MKSGRLAWLALGLIVVFALGYAAFGGDSSLATPAKQADTISRGVRCPTCSGQSVAESAAPAAHAIRGEIRRRIDAGESRGEIEAYLEDRYGSDILLTPPRSGFGGLVWIVPVVVVVGAAAGLGLALQRWSRRSLAHPTDADRALVQEQL
ncbi:MAG: cytochrome c-type biogenesis protein CcmH [Actinobacteria bacterium]|nr:cytochrome c-type biogenesis protein CcmH [Actinomycetota bacterium]